MNEKNLAHIKNVLSDHEYQAVTALIEEVNDKHLSEDSVGSYIKEIKSTLNIISSRKEMLINALDVLERYLECGERGDFEFEESIKGSQLLDV